MKWKPILMYKTSRRRSGFHVYLRRTWRLFASSCLAVVHFFLMSSSFLWLVSMIMSWLVWLRHRSGRTDVSFRFSARFWLAKNPCARKKNVSVLEKKRCSKNYWSLTLRTWASSFCSFTNFLQLAIIWSRAYSLSSSPLMAFMFWLSNLAIVSRQSARKGWMIRRSSYNKKGCSRLFFLATTGYNDTLCNFIPMTYPADGVKALSYNRFHIIRSVLHIDPV